jgi:hypothetical protein
LLIEVATIYLSVAEKLIGRPLLAPELQ